MEPIQNRADVESIPDQLNTLARAAPDGEPYPPAYGHEAIEELCLTFAEWMDEQGNVHFYWEDTTLSKREAEVVGLKNEGLTHDAITLFYTILSESSEYGGPDYLDGPTSRSTVDEYSRRAREKLRRAKATVDRLESLYGGEGPQTLKDLDQ